MNFASGLVAVGHQEMGSLRFLLIGALKDPSNSVHPKDQFTYGLVMCLIYSTSC